MLKQAMTAALVAAALTGVGATGAYADEAASWGSVTGNVAFTTNYNFRGYTQTQDDPAIQAGLTYTSPWGVYLGAWVSNIDFGKVGGQDVGAKIETDLSIGYAKKFGNFSLDIGGVYYLYGGANDNNTATKTAVVFEQDYYEFYTKLGYDFGFASVLGSVYGSPNFAGKSGSEIYYNASATIPLPFLPWNAALSGGVGYSTFFDDEKKAVYVTYRDYYDYSVGLGFTVPYGGLGLDFRYVGTDLPENEPGAVNNCSFETCKGTFIFTVSKSF